MTRQNKANADIIITTIISLSFTYLLCFMYAETGEAGKIVDFIALCLFPLVLILNYLNVQNEYIWLFSMALNILLYAYLLMTLFSEKLYKTDNYQPFILTHVTVYIIPSIVLIRLVYLIVISK
jgi:hypothetical protein